jgi:4-oxalomesaconate tautomerase
MPDTKTGGRSAKGLREAMTDGSLGMHRTGRRASLSTTDWQHAMQAYAAQQPRAQVPIRCTVMRGGTSKGLYFVDGDLPGDDQAMRRVLLAAMGSPDLRQINGMGGGDSLTSKVAIVGPSAHPDADLDYCFAQVSVERAVVDTTPSCGNILAGVGPFAIEAGLIAPQGRETELTVRDVNTGAFIDVTVPTPGGKVLYAGSTAIDGVPGTGAPVLLGFRQIAGSKTGRMLPTGTVCDEIDGVRVTCLDVAMPCVLIAAETLGKSGHEIPEALNADTSLLARLQRIRLEAGARMGLGDVAALVIPKVALLSRPTTGGSICSRYFVPHRCHVAHAVTGAICVASSVYLEGSVGQALGHVLAGPPPEVVIEHPSGNRLAIRVTPSGSGAGLTIDGAAVVSTYRTLFRGQVLVPGELWDQDGA